MAEPVDRNSADTSNRLVWWLIGLLAFAIGGFVAHVERELSENRNAAVINGRAITAIETRLPDSDRRLAAIEAGVGKLNDKMADLIIVTRNK